MSKSSTWSIGNEETGMSVGDNGGDKFKVYVAKLMPLISFGGPSEKTVGLNSGCYINSGDCKPSPSATVGTRNFIEAGVSSNSTMKLTGASAPHGTKLQIGIKNSNPDTITVVNVQDSKIN